jgi:hypothetical protein
MALTQSKPLSAQGGPMSKKNCITKPSTVLQELLLETVPADIQKKPKKNRRKELQGIAERDGSISYQEKLLLQALTDHNGANKSILKGLQKPSGLNQTYCLSLKKNHQEPEQPYKLCPES